MVLKVSISLAGETVITLEATESQVFREVVGLALKELPKDLVQMRMDGEAGVAVEKDRNVIDALQGDPEPQPVPQPTVSPSAGPEADFARFCAELSPMGDMRRLVAAAEGARRFLGMDRVSEGELGRLFDLAEWQRPADFVQTLRNAARSKFRWLERVSGTTGYYAVTPKGRDQVVQRGEE